MQAYVREATTSDLEQISSFESLAFINDPEMNWFGGLSKAIVEECAEAGARSLGNLRVFLDLINRSVLIVGGRITVIAIPQQSPSSEKLVAMAAWLPPHRNIEGPMTSLRARGHRSVLAWGLYFVWRASYIFKPPNGAIIKRSLEDKGLLDGDHYRLEITATDPEYHGSSTRLMEEAFAKSDISKPMTLEATTEHSRDVYSHRGFQIVESITLGKGRVDGRGLLASNKESSDGFQVYVMIKANFPGCAYAFQN